MWWAASVAFLWAPALVAANSCRTHSACNRGHYCAGTGTCYDCSWVEDHRCDGIDGDCSTCAHSVSSRRRSTSDRRRSTSTPSAPTCVADGSIDGRRMSTCSQAGRCCNSRGYCDGSSCSCDEPWHPGAFGLGAYTGKDCQINNICGNPITCILSVVCWFFVLVIYILFYVMFGRLLGPSSGTATATTDDGYASTAVPVRGHRIDHFADWLALSCLAWVCIIAVIAYVRPFACCRRDTTYHCALKCLPNTPCLPPASSFSPQVRGAAAASPSPFDCAAQLNCARRTIGLRRRRAWSGGGRWGG